MHPHAMTGLLNTTISAQEKIDKLRGVAPPEHVLHEHRETVSEFTKRMQGVPREQRLRIVD